jgi:hypothetical protein
VRRLRHDPLTSALVRVGKRWGFKTGTKTGNRRPHWTLLGMFTQVRGLDCSPRRTRTFNPSDLRPAGEKPRDERRRHGLGLAHSKYTLKFATHSNPSAMNGQVSALDLGAQPSPSGGGRASSQSCRHDVD